jgi:hypothetical protein
MSLADFTSIIDGDLGPRPESHLRRRLRGCDRRHRKQGIERNPSFLDRLERDIGRHQLGHRSRIPGVGRVFRLQYLSGIGFDHQQRFRMRKARRGKDERRDKDDPVQR